MSFTVRSMSEGPYGPSIARLIGSGFNNWKPKEFLDKVDAVTDAILATGRFRYGPKPNPENLVAIRDNIRLSVTHSKPVKFVIPWGSEKPDGSSIDVAEVMGIRMLQCLHNRISGVYEPGAEFFIRLEDASAPHLMHERAEAAMAEAKRYTGDFTKLAYILIPSSYLHVVPESSMVSAEEFSAKADQLVPAMTRYLKAKSSKERDAVFYDELVSLEWFNPVPEEMKEHYYSRYRLIYGPEEDVKARLARYFAGAWARQKLDIANCKQQNTIKLSFVGPVPGYIHYNTVFYRTLPSDITNNTMAPWRAKGYIKVGEDELKPYLSSFNNLPPDLVEDWLEFAYNGVEVQVRCDYQLVTE